jgi:hypothetical protein
LRDAISNTNRDCYRHGNCHPAALTVSNSNRFPDTYAHCHSYSYRDVDAAVCAHAETSSDSMAETMMGKPR